MKLPSKKQLKRLLSAIHPYIFSKSALILLAFIIPLLIIYSIDPVSFDYLWKGRAPFLLFIWLFCLEVAIGWKKLKKESTIDWSKKSILTLIILFLPTLYAIGLIFGLKSGIIELGKIVGVPIFEGDTWYLTHSWPFSLEYILFAGFFVAIIWLFFKDHGLKIFSVSAFFLGGVGIFYMIDTFYPNGTFTVLQALVPITTVGVASILNLSGYDTRTFSGIDNTLGLYASNRSNSYSAYIAWSCAGSHSLFLYSFMIMLFLRGTSISQKRKIFYVVLGAAGTFFVNILRIVTIYILGIHGGNSPAKLFHEFYGEFFFIAWMFIYLSLIYIFETRFINKTIKNKN
jgi:thaumarchaeosortase